MKKLLALVIFLLFLLLVWLSWGWYKDTVVCCPEAPAAVVYGPLIFECDGTGVITSEGWPEKKREILNARQAGKKLLLVGPYFGSEDPSMGTARAEAVKALFTELEPDMIVTDTRLGGDCEATKTNMLHELRYGWVFRNENIIQDLDRTLVFYKYDSDIEVKTPNVEPYFNELSEFLKRTGDRALITGHTDSDGEDAYNMELGLKRAEEYKAHLVSLGVDPSKLDTESKGESEPIRPNDTPENKQMNRRVEIHIIE